MQDCMCKTYNLLENLRNHRKFTQVGFKTLHPTRKVFMLEKSRRISHASFRRFRWTSILGIQ